MKFDKVYEGLIAELFNTKQNSEWLYTNGSFHTILGSITDPVTYMLKLDPFWELQLPAEAFDVKEMEPEQWNVLKHGTWHVEFGDDESDDVVGISGTQGMKASRIFSLIGNAIIDKVNKEPKVFKNLAFSAKEPSRRSLYSKLAPVLAKKINKDLVISDNGEWFYLVNK